MQNRRAEGKRIIMLMRESERLGLFLGLFKKNIWLLTWDKLTEQKVKITIYHEGRLQKQKLTLDFLKIFAYIPSFLLFFILVFS